MVARRYTRGPVASSTTPVVPDRTPGARVKSAAPNPRLSDMVSSLGQKAMDPNRQKRDFQPYGVGKPRYGGGRSAPNVGPVTDREGYKERDLKNRVMKARAQTLLKKKQKGQIANPRMPA